jgi:ADP-heptose:LPS heptosyltransferase
MTDRGARRIKFILDMIHPRVTLGRDTDGRGHFFDIKITETSKGEKYEMEYDIDAVRALGIDVVDKTVDLKFDEKSLEKVNEILSKEGITKETTVVGIHPGGMPSRRWPINNFAEAINMIGNKIPCKIVITGGMDEVNLASNLVRIAGIKAINLSGKLNFHELTALIKRCNVFISTDTGPMHIAAILKTPLVAIFGPGDITRFDPRNIFDKAFVLYKKADCAPCEKIKCNDLKCLKDISSEEVVKTVLSLINKNVK